MKLAKLYCVCIIVNIFVLIFSAELLEKEEKKGLVDSENDTLDLESEYQDFDYLEDSQDFEDYFAEPEIDNISDLEESKIAQGLKISQKSLIMTIRFQKIEFPVFFDSVTKKVREISYFRYFFNETFLGNFPTL